ncbi:MAG: hypothetical protein ACFB00_01400 [Parvularculaceae bacterium]
MALRKKDLMRHVLKRALFAGVAAGACLGAATAASPAPAVDAAPVAVATTLEESVTEAVAAIDLAAPVADRRRLLLAVAAFATLALIARLGGFRWVSAASAAVGPAAGRAGRMVAAASGKAVRAAVRVAEKPLRAVALFGGLAAFAFFGFALFDLEWLGGVILGGAFVVGVRRVVAKAARAFPLDLSGLADAKRA